MTRRHGFDRRALLRGGAALGLTMALPSVAPADGTPFRIGALVPLTGAGKPYGAGMQAALRVAVDEVNQAGGAGGRPLALTVEDDQTAPAHAVLLAKKLIEVDKVQAIVGTWASSVTLAVMKLTDAAALIEMNTSGAPEISTLDKKDLVWRFQATHDQLGRAFAAVARQRGFTRPATLVSSSPAGLGTAAGFKAAWEAAGGTLAAAVTYEPFRTSYRAELDQVRAAKPDAIVLGAYLPDATILFSEGRQSSRDLPWMIPGWAGGAELVKALGPEIIEGVISIDAAPNPQSASFTRFAAQYKAATGKDAASNHYAAMCYDMVVALALAIEAAGAGADVAAVNAKLREVANPPGTKVFGFAEGKAALKAGKIDYDGASSRLDFDAHGDVTPSFGVHVITKGVLQLTEIVTL